MPSATVEEHLRRIEAATNGWERRVAEAFLEDVRAAQSGIDTAALAAAVERAGAGAIATVPDVDWSRTLAAIQGAVLEGTQLALDNAQAVATIPDLRPPPGVDDPPMRAFIRDVQAEFVREVAPETRRTIAAAVERGLDEGRGARAVAVDVVDSIGLTARQEAAVRNFRRLLEENNPAALERELRDHRFDPTLREAVRTGAGIPREKVDRMVSRYRERFRRHRSQVIGRTETNRALNGGKEQYWGAQVQAGRVDGSRVRRFWHYTFDSRTRPAHTRVPAMNPEGVRLDEDFRTPLGSLRYPGDPRGRASNVVNCRCSTFVRVLEPE